MVAHTSESGTQEQENCCEIENCLASEGVASLSSLQNMISSKHNKGRGGEEQKQNDKMYRKELRLET